MPSKDSVFTPELIKIIKIFGLASVILVVVLSFFDTDRANNTGEDRTFLMTAASRLYFLNLKAINYNRENRTDAGMVLYRHSGFLLDEGDPTIALVLILNSQKDESYLYLEPQRMDWPLRIRVESQQKKEEIIFENGNKYDHLNQVKQLMQYLDQGFSFYLIDQNQNIPLWATESEKDALKSTLEDYFRLVEN